MPPAPPLWLADATVAGARVSHATDGHPAAGRHAARVLQRRGSAHARSAGETDHDVDRDDLARPAARDIRQAESARSHLCRKVGEDHQRDQSQTRVREPTCACGCRYFRRARETPNFHDALEAVSALGRGPGYGDRSARHAQGRAGGAVSFFSGDRYARHHRKHSRVQTRHRGAADTTRSCRSIRSIRRSTRRARCSTSRSSAFSKRLRSSRA